MASFADVVTANVSALNDGDNTVVAATAAGPGKRSIIVLGYRLRSFGAATAVVLKSGAGGTTHDSWLGAAAAPGAAIQAGYGDPEVGLFVVDAGSALVINNSAGVDTVGQISYRLV